MLIDIINIKEISQLASDQHFTTLLLIIAIVAVVTALMAVWRRSEEKDKKLEDCYQKHLDHIRHWEEMKSLLINRKKRST